MVTFSRCAASAVVLSVLAGSVFAQQGGTPVAVSGLTGQYGPGIGANAFSANSFSTTGRVSVINADGDVVMLGAFAGGAGVWRSLSGSGANTNLARGGQPLPAPASSGTYSTTLAWSTPFVDAAGNAMFYQPIAGTTGPSGWNSDAGIYRVNTAGAANFAVRGTNSGTQFDAVGAGTPLPVDRSASPAVQLNASTNAGMLMNNNGQTFLTASWRTAGGAQSGSGAWVGAASSGNYDTLTPAFLRGDTVSGFGFSDVQIDFITGVSFNDNARWASDIDFISNTGTPTRTSAQNRGLGTNRNGTTEVLMIRNVSAPWLDSGVIVGAIGSITPSMNNAGQIALAFSLQGTGVTAANDQVVGYFDADGSVSLLREGSNSNRTTGAAPTCCSATSPGRR
ncbi:MAG: hypothetical protein QM783_13735 [Phycisphaerales bacterium]